MLSGQSLLGKLLRLPLSVIPPQTEARILRGPLRGKKWVVGAASHSCWLGRYESDRLSEFERAMSPGNTVYDVGANVGIYSLLAAVKAGLSGTVYAFEPAPRNLQYLRRHMEINHLRNCTIVESAVCGKDGFGRFSSASWAAEMGRLSDAGEIEVPLVTLDTCIYGEKHFRPPDVVKIDVEGAEMDVLRGASRAIAEFMPTVFLEVHGTQLHIDCKAFLIAKGYSVEEGYGRIVAGRPAG